MNAVGNVEPFTIYVPQGRCARIDGTATHRNVKSLFTNGFSTCNIVAFQGKRSVSLIHFDTVAKRDILREEMEWTKEPVEVTICFRADIPSANVLKDYLDHHLRLYRGNQKIDINEVEVTRDESGIELSAEIAPDGTLKSDLLCHVNQGDPERLIRHPQELMFTTANKIEQLYTIGNFNFPRKKAVIFDGECWQKVPDDELAPFCPTVNETDLLDRLKSCAAQPLQIRNALHRFAERTILRANLAGVDPSEFAENLHDNALDFANDYDYYRIFKIRTVHLIENCRTSASEFSHDEQRCFDRVLEKLNSLSDCYEEVFNLMVRHPATTFWHRLQNNFKPISDHYRIGKKYCDLAQERVRAIAEVQRLVEEGNTLSQQGKIEEATDRLRLSLFTAKKYMTADNALIATCEAAHRIILELQNPQQPASATAPVAKRAKTQE